MKSIFKLFLSSIAAVMIFFSTAQADSIRIGTEGAYQIGRASGRERV